MRYTATSRIISLYRKLGVGIIILMTIHYARPRICIMICIEGRKSMCGEQKVLDLNAAHQKYKIPRTLLT